MTTLADLTPEERANCRGMWCDTPKGKFVLLAPMFPDREAFGWQLLVPSKGMRIDYPPEKITLRYDLPRAWTPDGTPPAGAWEDDYTDSDGSTLTTGEDVPGAGPHQHIRRFVGEWEQA